MAGGEKLPGRTVSPVAQGNRLDRRIFLLLEPVSFSQTRGEKLRLPCEIAGI